MSNWSAGLWTSDPGIHLVRQWHHSWLKTLMLAGGHSCCCLRFENITWGDQRQTLMLANVRAAWHLWTRDDPVHLNHQLSCRLHPYTWRRITAFLLTLISANGNTPGYTFIIYLARMLPADEMRWSFWNIHQDSKNRNTIVITWCVSSTHTWHDCQYENKRFSWEVAAVSVPFHSCL